MAASVTQVCSPDGDSIKIVKWKVKKDSTVTKGAVLAIYEVEKNGQDANQMKLKSTGSGIVDEILVESGSVASPGSVLMTLRPQESGGCTHPTVMKDMCAECGADLRREPGVAGDRKEMMTASVAMVHNIPELIISQEQALELGREDEQRLLKTRKLVLLVDLDQTLIHTTNDNIPPNLKDVYHFQMWNGRYATWYHTRLRPHTRSFLEKVSQMYELHICTFGVRFYAHTVARLIDPDEKIFSHRILSRDECFDPLSKTANLKALFPCGDSMVCIIDDREDVWNYAPNLVHVKPYRFFQGTADINAPPGLTKTENDDIPLAHKVIDHHHQAEDEEKSKEDGGENDGNEDVEKKDGNEEEEKLAPDKEEGENDSGDASVGGDDSRCGRKDSGDTAVSSEVPSEKEESRVPHTSQKEPADGGGLSDQAHTEERMDVGEESEQRSAPHEEKVPEDAPQEDKAKATEEELADDLQVSSESDSDTESKKETDEKVDEGSKDADEVQTVSQGDGDDSSAKDLGEGKDDETEKPAENEEEKNVDEKKTEKLSEGTDTEKVSVSVADATETETSSASTENMQHAKQTEHESAKLQTSESGATVPKDGDENRSIPAGENSPPAENQGSANDDEIEWDDEDDYLLHLEEILTRIHKAFYTFYDEGRTSPGNLCDSPDPKSTSEPGVKQLPDLKSIIPYVKRKALKGCNIVFSGVVPLNMPVEKSRAYIVAKSLGATVQPDIISLKDAGGDKSKATTHLVAQKAGTGKYKTALRTREVRIVNSGWLWACAERWERCDEQLFPLGKDDSSTPRKSKGKKAGRKRKSSEMEEEEEDENDEDSASSDQKRQRIEEADEVFAAEDAMQPEKSTPVQPAASTDITEPMEQASEGEMSEASGTSFANTVNPLLSFSDEDLECMDKEVDELLAEDASDDSDETEGERNERIRKTVLGQQESDSDSDSLSGDLPRGWGMHRKSPPTSKDDDLDKMKRKEMEVETEDTENELTSYQKTVDAFAPESESNSSFAESIGSVDDEIADAVEKEFLSSL